MKIKVILVLLFLLPLMPGKGIAKNNFSIKEDRKNTDQSFKIDFQNEKIKDRGKEKEVAPVVHTVTIFGKGLPLNWNLNVEGFSPAYYDKDRNAIAINTVEHPTDEWAAATKIFEKETGIYTIKFTSLLETDGESSYIVKIDGQKVMEFTNPRIYGKGIPEYEPHEVSVKDISIKNGSVIQVEFLPHSNNMVEEGEGFAFARARWKNDLEFVSQ